MDGKEKRKVFPVSDMRAERKIRLPEAAEIALSSRVMPPASQANRRKSITRISLPPSAATFHTRRETRGRDRADLPEEVVRGGVAYVA